MEMARQLVNSLAADFDPEKYHDEYREELLGLIEKKAAGEEIVAPETTEEPAKVLDLMAALEASLARTGASSAPAVGEEAATKAPDHAAAPREREEDGEEAGGEEGRGQEDRRARRKSA